jgi:nitrile hydratase subunit beta
VTTQAEAGGGRFAVGDRVVVRMAQPDGNPRTPGYTRGRRGRVIRVHGVVVNPLDHRDPYPPLYTVLFSHRELTGADDGDEVCADLHDEWLEPEHAAAS